MDNSVECAFWYVGSVAFFTSVYHRNKEMKVVCFEAKLPVFISSVPLQWYLDSVCRVLPRGYDFCMEGYSGRNLWYRRFGEQCPVSSKFSVRCSGL